jgi:hypothetical protein
MKDLHNEKFKTLKKLRKSLEDGKTCVQESAEVKLGKKTSITKVNHRFNAILIKIIIKSFTELKKNY